MSSYLHDDEGLRNHLAVQLDHGQESCAAEKRASAEATPVEAAGECDMKQRTGSPQKSGKAALRKSLSRREEGVGDFLRNFVPAALITTIIVLAVDTFVLGEGLRPLLPF